MKKAGWVKLGVSNSYKNMNPKYAGMVECWGPECWALIIGGTLTTVRKTLKAAEYAASQESIKER